MKAINYSKTHGKFVIKYIEDNEEYAGTINVDEKSIKSDLTKYIIDNEEGSTIFYKTNRGSIESSVEILIVKKEIDIVFDEVDEEKYFSYYYNKENGFINIKRETSIDPNNIYFQFYYKPVEYKIPGTISNKIISGLKNHYNQNGINSYKNIDDFYFFKKIFVRNFLKKFNLVNYNIIACVPSHNRGIFNNSPISTMINEISENLKYIDGSQLLLRTQTILEQKYQGKRDEMVHLNSIKINGNVKDKNIILIDDITTSGSSLKACKKILLDAGAKNVICFAFSKAS